MLKLAHESPKSIFKRVQDYTDYDYALVHLFEEDEEYFNLFKEALENGREVIFCLLYTSPSPRDRQKSRMPSSA